MVIDTRGIDFTLTNAIRGHVEDRLTTALRPLAPWIYRVTARLGDVNADRGGVDKRCRVVATMPRRRVLVIEADDTDLYAAVDTAAHRIRRRVAQAMKRHLGRERRDPQRPGAMVRK